MEDPIFRLEGVVRTRSDTENFEGPLALILQLLSKNKIEIRDISISLILDQYFEYLDSMAAMDIEVASEFVSMASHLVYIKTKTLLTGDEEISELEELKLSLEELARRAVYSRIKSVTPLLADMYRRGSGMLTKPPEYIAPDKEYRYSHDRGDLERALAIMMSRELVKRGRVDISTLPIPKRSIYSASDKAREIVTALRTNGVTYVRDIFMSCRSRSEMVAAFIAVLELCKMGSLLLSGDGDGLTACYTGLGSGEITDDYMHNGE